MDKSRLSLFVYVVLLTGANIYLWLSTVNGGSAPRSGKIMGLIIMLAIGAIFSDKFSNNPYAPSLIRAGSLIGMTVMFFVLYNI